jgi:hypothetical protein
MNVCGGVTCRPVSVSESVVSNRAQRSLDESPAVNPSRECTLSHGRSASPLSTSFSRVQRSLVKEQLIDVFKSVGQVVGFRSIRPPCFLLVLFTPS